MKLDVQILNMKMIILIVKGNVLQLGQFLDMAPV